MEMFRLSYEPHTVKSVRTVPSAVRRCWVEPTAGVVLTCLGPRTLQPIDCRSKVPQKLAKFDVERKKGIETSDVTVMTLYDATYCIHADSNTGRVSLRNISNPL